MTQSLGNLLLESARFRFSEIKATGQAALEQLSDEELYWQWDGASNSIAVIIRHLHGNMVSRWTDFLSSDGEKASRQREAEFDPLTRLSRSELMARWEEGWACLTRALDGLQPEDLAREITIRGQALGVVDAIERQLSHYAYHLGQIVLIAKHLRGAAWRSPARRPSARDQLPT